jgi:hypothetical protein
LRKQAIYQKIEERKMKKLMLGLMVLVSLMIIGCKSISKDAEVNAFIADSDKIASEIVRKVKANPTASGIDEAQRLLDAQKAGLKAKYDVLKQVRGYEVSEEIMKKFTDSTFKNIETVNGLKLDFVEKTLGDKTFGEKIDKLVNDFNAIYEV